jgi:2-hydroxychromene-2-carboxylate isomerase
MAEPIRFYLDFASPYAWFALDGIERLAREHGRPLEWRPVLIWAVLKAHDIAAPLNVPAKRGYFLTDMTRSAAFHGVPFRHPSKLPLSAHLASRLYYAIAERDLPRAKAFGRAVFAAFFTRDEDISDAAVVTRLAGSHGLAAAEAHEAMNGALGRERLAATVDAAIAEGVCGSPFFIVDGEPFFGADRLPQIAWRLASQAHATGTADAPAVATAAQIKARR